ncbi:hypothetical protein RI845_04355 [Thalassotalea nanhaiensis]|uniref:DUF485 domain-containing protein n=1 Tax=Thalassotalea nanhaiensis TaxID=3065648 RepID=A0ABY9TKR5_9GAMM|nr:hypothetical protein RI845_04355 [Colwelliaceae bacterium SQ345]
MCPFNEQQLESLFSKPMPTVDSKEFVQQTLDKANKRNFKRFFILQLFALIALIPLLYFLPTTMIINSISQFKIYELASIQSVLLSSVPLFIVALVCYFINDELA